jgi:hypothetical protein
MYYDFWATLYKHYIPKGFRVKVRYFNTQAYPQTAFIMPVLTETPVIFTPNQIIETPFVKVCRLEQAGGRSSGEINFSVPFKELYRLNAQTANNSVNPVNTDLTLRFPTTANMGSFAEVFFVFGSFRTDGGSSSSIQYQIDLTVIGEFTDPILNIYSLDQPKLRD